MTSGALLALLKFSSIAVTASLGLVALMKETRDRETHELTRWGKFAIWGIVVSAIITALAQKYEIEQQRATDKSTIQRLQNDTLMLQQQAEIVRNTRRPFPRQLTAELFLTIPVSQEDVPENVAYILATTKAATSQPGNPTSGHVALLPFRPELTNWNPRYAEQMDAFLRLFSPDISFRGTNGLNGKQRHCLIETATPSVLPDDEAPVAAQEHVSKREIQVFVTTVPETRFSITRENFSNAEDVRGTVVSLQFPLLPKIGAANLLFDVSSVVLHDKDGRQLEIAGFERKGNIFTATVPSDAAWD